MTVVAFRRVVQKPRASADPVDMYLSRLSPGASRDGCRYLLQEIAPLLGAKTLADVDWPALRYQDAVKMLAALEAKGLGIASRKKARNVLRGVLKECWRLGLMNADELARASDTATPKGEVLPAGRALTAEECTALWRATLADTSQHGRRNAALLALLYATGMRRNELRQMRLEDYDRTTGAVRILHGKGSRQREALVADADLRAVIAAWLDVRGDRPGYLLTAILNGRLVVRNAPMAGERLQRILYTLCRRAGIEKAGCHDVRRTVATYLAERVPLDVVQRYLGHKQITTTQLYVRRFSATALQQAAASITLPPGTKGE